MVQQLSFTVVGSDQGLASSPTTVDTLLIETGSRYDIVVDFKSVAPGNRVIMKNIGGDEPFGGDIPGPQAFGATDYLGNPINWPNTSDYVNAGPTGQMEGSIAWHSPTTENPAHLHLVHFQILGRQEIQWDSHTTRLPPTRPDPCSAQSAQR